MSGSDGREIYRVVWPRGARTVQATDVAPRLSTLEGKTIGQLWDDLFRGDEIFPILEEELARRFPGRPLRPLRHLRLHPRPRRAARARRAAGDAAAPRGRRGHLRDGLLRELHARRVAGQCGGRAGRRADRVAGLRGLPRPGRHHRRPGSGCPACPPRSCRATSTCRARRSCGANVAAVTVDAVIRNLTEAPPRAGGAVVEPAPGGHRLRGQLRRGQPLLLRERLERRPAHRAADARARRRVPALHRPARRDRAGRAPARQAPRHRLERGGQRRDGGLPARVHADPGGAGRGDGRSALRRRAQRQHAGRRDADHPERAAHQGARLQLRAGRAARRHPGQHHRSGASGASTCATSRASSITAPTRAPSATPGAWCWPRTRTRCAASAGPPSRRTRAWPAATRSRSRATPAAASSRRCSATRRSRCCRIWPTPSLGKVGWELMFTVGMGVGSQRPLLMLSPILAETLAKGGLDKATLKQRLFELARIPAREVRALRGRLDQPGAGAADADRAGEGGADPRRLRRVRRSGAPRADRLPRRRTSWWR